MTKVCHFTSAHYNTDNRIFEKECKSLANAGYDVYLVGAGKSREEDGVHVIGLGDVPSSRIKRLLRFSRKAVDTAKGLNCEIYHFHDPELLFYALSLKKLGKKVIFDSHEKYSDQIAVKSYLGSLAPLIAKIYSAYENHVIKRIDAVIFPCTIRGKNPFEGKCKNVELISNVPKLEELYDNYDPSVEKIKDSLCYLGSLTVSRGVTIMKEAAERTGAKLILAGPFSPREYEDEITSSDNVCYYGILNREQILNTIQQCRIGLSLLKNVGQYYEIDTLSTKIYEYMSLGLPVIMQDSPYCIEINKEYEFGVCVSPEDADSVAETVLKLLYDSEERERLGRNGRKTIKEVFNWEKEEKKLINLYRRILES